MKPARRKKPEPKFGKRLSDRSPAFRYRASRTVEKHPWWTLTSITSLAALWPVIFPLLALLAGYIDTPAEAKKREDTIKQELQTKMDTAIAERAAQIAQLFAEVAKLHAELTEHKASDARQTAGFFTQTLRTSVTVARNRVNDCNIMKQEKGKRITPLELSACYQYEQEYEDAKRQFEQAQSSAAVTWHTQ